MEIIKNRETSREVRVWLPGEGETLSRLPCGELLHEAHGLSRRLDLEINVWSDISLKASDLEWLGAWGIRKVNTLSQTLSPHPLFPEAMPFPESESVSAQPVPLVTLFSHDAFGCVAAPLTAAQSGADLLTSISGVTHGGGRFVAIREVFGQKFEAQVSLKETRPVVMTLKPGALGEVLPPTGIKGKQPQVQTRSRTLPEGDSTSIHQREASTLAVDEAERIVAIGRGAFDETTYSLAVRLAELLGATLAGTRPAADEGWLPFARQIGLTGAVVRPRLYVAVGISGAPYHMMGVQEPETLIAINNDPEAPIFNQAHLGIVADAKQVLPAWIKLLEAGKTGP